MEPLINLGSIIFPYIIFIVYILGVFYLVKMIVYVRRLPEQFKRLETRIKQLEEKEKK